MQLLNCMFASQLYKKLIAFSASFGMIMFAVCCNVDAFQQDSFSKIKPAAPPQQDPFSDYVQEEAKQTDPFSDYVQEPAARQSNIKQNDLRSKSSGSAGSETSKSDTVNPAANEYTSRPVAAGSSRSSAKTDVHPSWQPNSRTFVPRSANTDSQGKTPPVQAAPKVGTIQDLVINPSHTSNQGTSVATTPPITNSSSNPASTTTLAPRKKSPNILLAKRLLGELQSTGMNVQELGQPMGLLDMMANSDMNRRKGLIKQYWTTYAAWAEYQYSIEELRTIQKLGPVRTETDRSTLEAALSAANDSIAASRLELSQQQHLLNQFLLGERSTVLPLPSDTPIVSRYVTNFDLYAARGNMPDGLRMINQWLPQQQQLIGDRAATVQRCRNAVQLAMQSISQGQPVPSMLQTMDLCRRSNSNFVKTVIDYNQQIAEYAITLWPNENKSEEVVAMLIPARPSSSLPSTSPFGNEVRQATLPESQRQPMLRSTAPVRPNNRSSLPQMNSNSGNSAFPGTGNSSGQTLMPAGQRPSIDPDSFGKKADFQPPLRPAQTPGGFQR